MLGRAPQTKETLPDFCENMDPDKWDTTVWYRVTRNPPKFLGFMGYQRDIFIYLFFCNIFLSEHSISLMVH